MAQSFRVVRCYQCETFQVDIEKKASKWQCKICQEKQSLKQVYHRGSGLECRKAVQQLNLKRRDEAVRQEEQISYRQEEQISNGHDEQISYGQDEQISYGQDEQISYGQEEQISYGHDEQISYGLDEQVSYGEEGHILYRQEEQILSRQETGPSLREEEGGQKTSPVSSHRHPALPPAKTSRWAKFLPPETQYSDEEEDEEVFLVPQQPRKVPQQPRKRKSSEAAVVKVADGGPGKWGRFQL